MKIICPKHGPIIPIKMCPHIREYIQTGCLSKEDFETICINYEDIDPEDATHYYYPSHRFCKQCVKKYALPIDYPVLSGEMEGKYKEAFTIASAIICPKCFDDSIQEN
jgi:hypothetical protein